MNLDLLLIFLVSPNYIWTEYLRTSDNFFYLPACIISYASFLLTYTNLSSLTIIDSWHGVILFFILSLLTLIAVFIACGYLSYTILRRYNFFVPLHTILIMLGAALMPYAIINTILFFIHNQISPLDHSLHTLSIIWSAYLYIRMILAELTITMSVSFNVKDYAIPITMILLTIVGISILHTSLFYLIRLSVPTILKKLI